MTYYLGIPPHRGLYAHLWTILQLYFQFILCFKLGYISCNLLKTTIEFSSDVECHHTDDTETLLRQLSD